RGCQNRPGARLRRNNGWLLACPPLRGSSQHSCLNHRWGMALVSWLVHLLVSPISRARGRRAPSGVDGAPTTLVHGREGDGIEDLTDGGIDGAKDIEVDGRT